MCLFIIINFMNNYGCPFVWFEHLPPKCLMLVQAPKDKSFLTRVTPTLISSGPRETLMKQPGKSPSSLSSRSFPWCRAMWSSPGPWPACLDGSNSSVTSSWPTVKSWPKLLAMEEMELSESVETERLSWATPIGSSSLLISSRWPRSRKQSGVSPRARLGLRLEVVEVRRWLLAATRFREELNKEILPTTPSGYRFISVPLKGCYSFNNIANQLLRETARCYQWISQNFVDEWNVSQGTNHNHLGQVVPLSRSPYSYQ